MTNFRFKIALPGYDVRTATPEQCAVDSDYASPKIDKRADPPHRGLIALNTSNTTFASGDTIVYQFAHGYSYTPSLWAVFAENSRPNIFGFSPYVSGVASVSAKTDDQYFYIVVSDPPGVAMSFNLLCSYAIFAENGAAQ